MSPPTSDVGDSPRVGATSLDDLTTEAGSRANADYELRSTIELVELMNAQDAIVPDAVRGVAREIAAAIDAVSSRLARGGRLVYAGAGSSGRIAALDASECESTFSTRPGEVVALVAGGVDSPPLVQEAAEDDRAAGEQAVEALDVRPEDTVLGVSASGRTPYVLGALAAAARAGALTACVVSVEGSELGRLAEHEIAVLVGPEFIAGSTRLKAGTAQKLVLNMLSTISMIRLGKTFGNLMVDVQATNEKLRARVVRIVRTATGASEKEAERALRAADGETKVAIVSLLADVDAADARSLLEASGQNVREASSR
ncbi:MAG TPA: N-acetylmuramic acid 6-phosphate etherase [Gaiellaceae bacterium]|nr:N-acetylmuramic acid 6-phosphate etherase [Gaiellaceae bacterium]